MGRFPRLLANLADIANKSSVDRESSIRERLAKAVYAFENQGERFRDRFTHKLLFRKIIVPVATKRKGRTAGNLPSDFKFDFVEMYSKNQSLPVVTHHTDQPIVNGRTMTPHLLITHLRRLH